MDCNGAIKIRSKTHKRNVRLTCKVHIIITVVFRVFVFSLLELKNGVHLLEVKDTYLHAHFSGLSLLSWIAIGSL